MHETFVGLLIFGIIVALASIWVAGATMDDKESEKKKKQSLFVSRLFMVMACVQATHLEYGLTESSRKDADELVKAAENSRCKGSIIIQYPGNPPKTIVLK